MFTEATDGCVLGIVGHSRACVPGRRNEACHGVYRVYMVGGDMAERELVLFPFHSDKELLTENSSLNKIKGKLTFKQNLLLKYMIF